MNVPDSVQDDSLAPTDNIPFVQSLRIGNRTFTPWRLAFLAVLAISILAYLPALQGEKVWDDHLLLSGVGIGGGESAMDAVMKPFLNAYFRPLVSLSFYYENRLWNGTPFLYHQTNILIHAATTALLVGVLLIGLGSRKIALLGGLLFAIQPAQVSTVAWIGGRTDSMCSLFVAAFAYGLLRAIRVHGRKRTLWAVLSALAFFCALLTKEPILALLPLVPLGLWAFGEPGERRSRTTHLKFAAPYLLASLAFVASWLALYPNPFKPLLRTIGDQVLTAGHSSSYYALLLLFPNGKWMHTLSLGNFEATGLASALAGLAILAFAVIGGWLLIRKEPRFGWFVALALLAILPVDNLVPLPSLVVAPYRAGVAGLGVAAGLAIWFLRGARLGAARTPLIAAYCAWCAFLTWWGAAQWSDPISIFSRISNEDPTSTIARRNLSFAMLRAPGDPVANAREAIKHMEGSLTLMYGSEAWRDPGAAAKLLETDEGVIRRVSTNQGNHVEPWALVGELFAQLGFARNKAMDAEGSRQAFETTLAISPANFPARVGLAQYSIHEGKFRKAAQHLRVAFAAWPKEPSIPAMLGQVYAEMGDTKNATQSMRQSIAMKPWFGPTYLLLADVQLQAGDRAGALITLQESTHCRVQDQEGLQQRLAALGATADHSH